MNRKHDRTKHLPSVAILITVSYSLLVWSDINVQIARGVLVIYTMPHPVSIAIALFVLLIDFFVADANPEPLTAQQQKTLSEGGLVSKTKSSLIPSFILGGFTVVLMLAAISGFQILRLCSNGQSCITSGFVDTCFSNEQISSWDLAVVRSGKTSSLQLNLRFQPAARQIVLGREMAGVHSLTVIVPTRILSSLSEERLRLLLYFEQVLPQRAQTSPN